jgi:hypothetical protein
MVRGSFWFQSCLQLRGCAFKLGLYHGPSCSTHFSVCLLLINWICSFRLHFRAFSLDLDQVTWVPCIFIPVNFLMSQKEKQAIMPCWQANSHRGTFANPAGCISGLYINEQIFRKFAGKLVTQQKQLVINYSTMCKMGITVGTDSINYRKQPSYSRRVPFPILQHDSKVKSSQICTCDLFRSQMWW